MCYVVILHNFVLIKTQLLTFAPLFSLSLFQKTEGTEVTREPTLRVSYYHCEMLQPLTRSKT